MPAGSALPRVETELRRGALGAALGVGGAPGPGGGGRGAGPGRCRPRGAPRSAAPGPAAEHGRGSALRLSPPERRRSVSRSFSVRLTFSGGERRGLDGVSPIGEVSAARKLGCGKKYTAGAFCFPLNYRQPASRRPERTQPTSLPAAPRPLGLYFLCLSVSFYDQLIDEGLSPKNFLK